MAEATDRLGIRISPEIKQGLKVQAKKEGRSVAGLIIFVLRKYLVENGAIQSS